VSRHDPNAALRPVVVVTRPDKSVQICPCISCRTRKVRYWRPGQARRGSCSSTTGI
jgi:hypothetical protein